MNDARVGLVGWLGMLGAGDAEAMPQTVVEVLSPRDGRKHRLIALIDSGADITCIADRVMKELGYQPARSIGIVSAAGRDERHLYVAELRFPDMEPVHRARVEVAGLPVLGTLGQPGMLLGRDVLEQGHFCWDGRTRQTLLHFGP